MALAEQLGGLDVQAMAARRPFVIAVEQALAVATEAEVVAQVVGMGSLAGSRNPHAVVVSRLQQVPTLAAMRARAAAEASAQARRDAIARAARHGARLARVDGLDAENAAGMLRDAYAADSEALAAALGALEGRRA